MGQTATKVEAEPEVVIDLDNYVLSPPLYVVRYGSNKKLYIRYYVLQKSPRKIYSVYLLNETLDDSIDYKSELQKRIEPDMTTVEHIVPCLDGHSVVVRLCDFGILHVQRLERLSDGSIYVSPQPDRAHFDYHFYDSIANRRSFQKTGDPTFDALECLFERGQES